VFRRAIAVLVALVASSVASADTAERVTLTYAAPEGCPSRDELEAAVRARMPLVQFVAAGHRTFAITIAQRSDDFDGTLAVADDPASARELSAHRCDDLVGALALITALAIDPTSGTTAAEVRAPRPPETPEPPTPPWQAEADAIAGVAFGVGADAMPALRVEGRVVPRPYLALALAAIVGYDRATFDMGAAQFVWMVARPAACWRPLRGQLELDACAHIEAGAVRASGENIVLGQSITRAWIAAGVHLDALWRLSPLFYVQLEVAASAPFQRDRYLFQPATTIYETPALTGWVGVGGGLHFR
jgi:hypothetical protein